MRLLWLFLGLAVLFLIPFFLWGDALEATFSHAGITAWLGAYGRWAWAAALALLVGDLLLPIPASVVMTALGLLYGPVAGGLISAAGSFLAGSVAYGLCRGLGRGAARRLLGEADLARGERLFERVGGWLVVASRWLPVLPEVIACLAGLTRMPAGRFHLALACGAVPVGFTFAALGYAGADRPVLALVLSALVPPLLWLVVRPFIWDHSPEG
ncbi:DedA family protein [Rhodothermaceae bacterium RA]|nr:DedA family protein [Rhodothermaceae bacterium RA]